MAIIGGKLRINNEEFDRLKALGWTQKKIARSLNVSQSTISKYMKERGLRQ